MDQGQASGYIIANEYIAYLKLLVLLKFGKADSIVHKAFKYLMGIHKKKNCYAVASSIHQMFAVMSVTCVHPMLIHCNIRTYVCI